MQQALQAVSPLEHKVIHQSETELVRLALSIAARVLRRDVHTNDAWFDDILRVSLSQVPRRRPIEVRMHPDDAALVQARAGEFAAAAGGEDLNIIGDGSCSRGDCRLSCWYRYRRWHCNELAATCRCLTGLHTGDQPSVRCS